MSASDSVLICRWIKARDAEAFRELVSRHAQMVYATARRILRNTADAEDVAQDCFLKLVQSPSSALHTGAWLHRVATNRSLDILRAEKRRRGQLATPPRIPEDPNDRASWHEVEVWVDRAIDRLPEEFRIPVVLKFLKGETNEAIAKSLGISKATVSYRIQKGIGSIRHFLRKRGVHAAPSVLIAWLSTSLMEAAPEGLLASLGKIALAGHGGPNLHGSFEASAPIKPGLSLSANVLPVLCLGGSMKILISAGAPFSTRVRSYPPTCGPSRSSAASASRRPA